MKTQLQSFYLVQFLLIFIKNNTENLSASKIFKIFSILILGLYFSVEVFAGSGDIDRSFGVDGFSKLSIGSSTNRVSDSVIQPDGKLSLSVRLKTACLMIFSSPGLTLMEF